MKNQLKEEILRYIEESIGKKVNDPNKNLFSVTNNLRSRDVAYLLLWMKDKYGVDLNKLVDTPADFTIDEYARLIILNGKGGGKP